MAHLSAAAKVAPARKEEVHEPPDFQPSVKARAVHESWKKDDTKSSTEPDIDMRATHNGIMSSQFKQLRSESPSPSGFRSQFTAGVSIRSSKRDGVPLQAVEQMKSLVEEANERNDDQKNVTVNPTLFHPNARWRFRWDMFMAVLILYSVVIIPLRIGFDVLVRDSSAPGVLDIMVDLFFAADMCVNFNTAYINESTEQLVEDRKRIARKYMRSWFTIDILSTLPIDRIVVWTGGGGSSNIRSLKLIRTLRLVRLLKLMRVFKLQKMATLLQELNINPALLRLAQMLCVLIFVAHLLACFWSFLALPELIGGVERERLRSWRQTSSLPDLQDGRRGTMGEEYLLAFYWVVASMMAVGYGDITAATDSERLYSIVTQVIGAACFGFIIATVTQVIETMSPRASTFKAKMNDVADYMAFRGLPKDLRRKINRHFEFYYSKSSVFKGPHAFFGEDKILANMPQELRMHTVTYVHGDSLDKLKLFAGHDEPCFVAEMAARVQPMMAPTGYVIFKKNEVAEEMYFLTKGKVHMLVNDGDGGADDIEYEEFLESFIKQMSPVGSMRHVEWSSKGQDEDKRPKMPSSPLASALSIDDMSGTPAPASNDATSGAGAADAPAAASHDLLRIASSHHNTDIGQTTVCGVLTEGMHFGDQELLMPAPRRFTTMSCVFSELLTLTKKNLEEVLYLFPESAARMVKMTQECTKATMDAVASETLKPYKMKERALVVNQSSKNLTPLLGQGSSRRVLGQSNLRKNVAAQPHEAPQTNTDVVGDESVGESENEADFVFDWVPQRKARIVLDGKLQYERLVDRDIFIRSSTLESVGDGMSAGEGGVLSVREKKAVFQEKLASVTRPTFAHTPPSPTRKLKQRKPITRSQTMPGAVNIDTTPYSPPVEQPSTPPVVIKSVAPPVDDATKAASSAAQVSTPPERVRRSFSNAARDIGHKLEDSVQIASRKLSGSAHKAMGKLAHNRVSPDEVRRREQVKKKAEVQKRKQDVEQLRRMDRMSSSMMSFDNEILTSKSSVAYLNLQKGFCLVEETVQQVHSRYIIHPDDPWKLKWDMWIGLLIIYSVLFVPLRIGFFLEVDSAQAAIDWAMDGCFFIDICLSFRCAYRHPVDAEVVVTALSMIRGHYLRGWFTIDFISTVPFDHIAQAFAGSGTSVRAIKLIRVVRLFRLLKLLRLFKLRALWRMVGEHLEVSPLVFRMIKLFGQLVFIAHLFGCMWHYVSDANSTDTWVEGLLNRVGDNSTEPGSGAILDDNLTSRYISAIYWAFTTMTTVGYGDITPQNSVERSYAVVIMILGGTVFGYIVGSIASLVGSPRQGSGRTEAASQGLNVYLEEQQLPAHIRTHAKKHFQYLWSRKVDAMGEGNILAELPIVLRREVLIYAHREEISKIPIFSGGRDVAFIAYVVQRMRPAAFPKEQFIISQGFSARAIHFIISGMVEKVVSPRRAGTLVTEQETVQELLTTGDFFGHEALLCSSRHEYGIRTCLPCQVYTLTKEEIGKMVDDSPIVALKLQQAMHAAVSRQAGRKTKVNQLSVDPFKNFEERQAAAHATVQRAADGYHATHRSSKPLPVQSAEPGKAGTSNSSRWRLANILSLSAHAHQYRQSLGAMRRLSIASGIEQSYVHDHMRMARMTPAADSQGGAASQEGAADEK